MRILILLLLLSTFGFSQEKILLNKYYGTDSAQILIDNQHDQVKIGIDGSQNMTFRDSACGTKTLSQLAGGNAPEIHFHRLASSAVSETLYVDAYVMFYFRDAATDDLEFEVIANPSTEEVHVVVIDEPTTLTAYDRQVSDGLADIDSDVGNDDRLSITVWAPSDDTYPTYRIQFVKSNSSGYTNTPGFMLVEKWTTYDN